MFRNYRSTSRFCSRALALCCLTPALSYELSDSTLSFHFYADDTQLYISFLAPDSSTALSTLSDTLENVHSWLTCNRLCLNPSKTEFLLIGTSYQRERITQNTLSFSGVNISVSESSRYFGVVFDSELSFNPHISNVVKSCYCWIRQMRKIRASLDYKFAVLLANSLVSAKLDFCSSLYSGISKSLIQRLQLVQNSLARVVSRNKKV